MKKEAAVANKPFVIYGLLSSENLFRILLILAALVGMGMVAYATRYGPGVGGDTTIYLASAQNLLAGKGLGWTEADGSFRLLPYTPPFYPLVLSGVGLVIKDMVAGSRWLNMLLFGATIALGGWFFYRYTGRAWLAGILSGVVATSPVLLGVQVWAMSEPLFLFLGLAGLFLILEYMERPPRYPRRRLILVASALFCGLAFLTRYMGVAYVVTGGLALLLFGRNKWLDRIREAFGFGVIAILPALAWLVIDFSLTGTVGSRSGQPAAVYWQRFLEMGPALQKIYLFWLLPDSIIPRLPRLVQIALWLLPLAGLVWLGIFLYHRLKQAADSSNPFEVSKTVKVWLAARLAALFALFIVVYLIVLAIVQVFTFPPITLAARMLSPVHLAVIVLVFTLMHLVLAYSPNPSISGLRAGALLRNARRPLAAILYLGCLALLGSYALRGALVVRDYHRSGIGYTAPAWRNSKLIETLRKLPADVPIISNETTAVMFLDGRPAYALQEIYQSDPSQEFTAYGAGDDVSQRVFREQKGALVLFKSTLSDDFAMYGDRAGERIQALTRGLSVYFDSEDGAIYFYK